jgi:acetyl esterase/lipase
VPLDRGAERLLKMLAVTGRATGPLRTAEGRRRALEALAEMVEETPAEPVETSDRMLPGPGGPLAARLYVPPAAGRGCIVYFHGGGWVAGGLATHDGVCRRLALGAATRVLAVDYRLAPEHPFPAAFEDALAAVRWAADEAESLGFDPARLVVAGDSAGAGLAAAVAQSRERPPLALQLLLCPILSPAEDSASRRAFADGYFLESSNLAADLADYCGGGADPRDPRLSPLLAADLAGLPPALIHTAEYDPFRDEGEAYARRLRDAGVGVRQTRHGGMIHYFYAMPRAIGPAAEALAGIGAEVAAELVRVALPRL